MREVATALLFDKNGRLLMYLRDDKPSIPFPNHWDLFGGHVEEGETPTEALKREVEEEIGVSLEEAKHFRDYVVTEGDAYPNVKHVFWARLDVLPEELTLHEGQCLTSIDLKERGKYKFANVLGSIIDDFAKETGGASDILTFS